MLGEKLYQLRRSRGLSQEQLAERVGVSRQTISKWEGDQSTPDLEKLIALADCFGITLDELVRGQLAGLKQEEAAPQTEQQPFPNKFTPGSLIGILLLLSGVVGLAVTGMVWLTNPDAIEIINNSSELTVNGSGLIFSICVLGMIFGINLILKKD